LLPIVCLKISHHPAFTLQSANTIDMGLWYADSWRNAHSLFSWSCSVYHQFILSWDMGIHRKNIVTTSYILSLTYCILLSDNPILLWMRKSIPRKDYQSLFRRGV
jgi:hypothetical protein